MHNIKKELIYRMSIIGITSIILLITETQNINDTILIMLNPIKEIHSDWHNAILYELINNTFISYDHETTHLTDAYASVEYIPACEISIKSAMVNNTITKITIYLITVTIFISYTYHLILFRIPSLYMIEKKIYIRQKIGVLICVYIAITLTHNVWATLYLNIAFHNYQEFNYYEFDVDFDIHNYISKYIWATCIHCVILLDIKKKNIYGIILSLTIIILATQIMNIIEIIYYLLLILSTKEIKIVLSIFNKKLQH